MSSSATQISPEEAYNAPVTPSDAAQMFLVKTNKNERPYDLAIKKLNNRFIEQWKTDVLDRVADSRGTIASGTVYSSYSNYQSYHDISMYIKSRNNGELPPVPTRDEALKWYDFLRKSSIKTICKRLSRKMLQMIYTNVIQAYLYDHTAQWFWDNYYSTTTDLVEIDKMKESFPKDPVMPEGFDMDELSDIEMKVMIILRNVPKPN